MSFKSLFAFLPLLVSFSFVSFSQNAVSERVENSLSAVVTVTVEKAMPVGKALMGFRGSVVEEAYERSLSLSNALSSGSGFLIQQNGKKYVVTNAHVVESASDEPGSIFVYSFNRKKYEVKVLGGDSFYDIAVLEFVTPPGNELTVLEFATELPRIASRVYAIGNPLGEFPYTVTDGIVSAVNRTRGSATGKFGFIQSTATVIWGNSGGPLIDEDAKVVGINTQIHFAQGPDGRTYLQQQLNFSLESILAQRLVNDIINRGKVIRSFLGIELVQRNQLVRTQQGGLAIGRLVDEFPVIGNISQQSPSYGKISKYKGKQVTHINKIEIRNLEEALGEFEKVKPGSDVELTILDGAQKVNISLKAESLEKKHLEQLADEVLSRNKNVSIDRNSAQLKLTLPYQSPNPRFQWTSQDSDSKKEGGASFFVLAGGAADYDVWRITSLADAGALLRVYGLRGGIEFLLSENSAGRTYTRKIVQYFSDDDKFFQANLWY